MVTVKELKRYNTPFENILQYAFASKLQKKSLLGHNWFKESLKGKTVRFPHNYKTFGMATEYERMDTYKALLQSVEEAVSESTLVQEEISTHANERN